MLFIITGVGRSGTTLITMMLNSHSKVSVPYESNFFVKYYLHREKHAQLDKAENRLYLAQALLNESRVQLWDHSLSIDDMNIDNCNSIPNAIEELYQSYAKKDGKTLWGDKTPGYVDQVDILWKIFPGTKIIHIYRDGRDVALSVLTTGWWSMSDLMSTLMQWRKKVETARKMLRNQDENLWIEIKYEDFVKNPESSLRDLCQFLNIEYESNMLSSYGDAALKKLTAALIDSDHKNLMQPPSSKQSYKWKSKLLPADQALAYKLAGPLLEELGYDSGIKHYNAFLVTLRRVYHYMVKIKLQMWRVFGRLTMMKPKRSHLNMKKSKP